VLPVASANILSFVRMVTALTRLGILIWRGFFTTSLSALHYIPFSMREAFESNLQKAGVSEPVKQIVYPACLFECNWIPEYTNLQDLV